MSDSSAGGGGTGGRGRVFVEVRIDEVTWSSASRERRQEWRVVLDELIAEHRFDGAARLEPRLALHVSVDATEDGARIVWEARAAASTPSGEAAEALLRDEIALAAMAEPLREYFDICREMGGSTEGPNSPRLEALDIAKRIVHDEAAEALQRHLRALGPDHATARRLFTLLVTLHFDTTRLVRPHHLDAALERRRFRER